MSNVPAQRMISVNGHRPLVCFDLGGVIVRICRSWDEACRAAGVSARPLPVDDEARMKRVFELVHAHQVGRVDTAAFAARYSDLVDGLYSPEEVYAVHEAWLLGEYDGVATLVEQLHAREITTAALSNTNESHWRDMLDYPTMRRMHHRLASHLLGLAKPDPAIYRAAEQHLGIAGESIIFFDDLEANVRAASAAGWHAHQIDHTGCPASQMIERLRAAEIL